jgi:hypothetical protein
MMNDNEAIIKKYGLLNCKFTNIKKKEIYLVKDGYTTYNVSINPLKCQCSRNILCYHTIFILKKEFGVTDDVLKFTHRLLPKICELSSTANKENNINEKLLEEINTNIISDVCAICLSAMNNDNNFCLTECVSCGKFAHASCLQKWFNKKNVPRVCIYCKQ